MPRDAVRIFRRSAARNTLLLHDGSGLFDLSAYLARRGQPDDLVDLVEDGWFAPEELEQRLPRNGAEGWEALDEPFDGNAPAGVATPVARRSVGKILCLGKNFRAHAEEFGEEVPEEPLFFNKLPETLVPHRATVTPPAWYAGRVDHEAELALLIGLAGRDIARADAMEHVAGFTVANDLTARTLQGNDRALQYPWFRGKNLDGFCPLGPCFVPRDYLDIGNLAVTADVNGERRQDASTRDWLVDAPHALEWLSKHLTLHPGDLVLMGTPAGVGPLVDGDVVVCAVEGIGALETTIRRPTA
jgi:2-keto-4-pentenoate hydratase/2-oxohepta-3-ene-1,7-dioic acid hydratase in catechol pathway